MCILELKLGLFDTTTSNVFRWKRSWLTVLFAQMLPVFLTATTVTRTTESRYNQAQNDAWTANLIAADSFVAPTHSSVECIIS